MKEIFEAGMRAMNLATVYPVSLYGGFKDRKLFEEVETYCMFTGCPRIQNQHRNFLVLYSRTTC